MSAAPHAEGPRLLADIAGRHARFALETAPGRMLGVALLDCAEYLRFEDAVGDYLASRAPMQARPVRHAVVAMAQPAATLARAPLRHPWAQSLGAAHATMQLDTLLVVSDCTALAMAMPGLPFPVLAGAATLLAQALHHTDDETRHAH
jgi:glucokinase